MTSEPQYIGTATMQPDGTIVLDLRAQGPGNAIGDARLTYAPTHQQYRTILDHVGPLAPGQSKPVRPFPSPSGRGSG